MHDTTLTMYIIIVHPGHHHSGRVYIHVHVHVHFVGVSGACYIKIHDHNIHYCPINAYTFCAVASMIDIITLCMITCTSVTTHACTCTCKCMYMLVLFYTTYTCTCTIFCPQLYSRRVTFLNACVGNAFSDPVRSASCT